MASRKTGARIFIVLLSICVAVFVIAQVGYLLLRSRTVEINPLFIGENAVRGVDVSSYQADIDMDVLKSQGIQFIYIKATEGSGHVDEYFQENWTNAHASGLAAGAYHFFSFDSAGEAQAALFIGTVGSLDGALLPVVDVEYYADKKENPPARDDVIRELGAFLDALEAYYGVKPMIYAPQDLYDKFLSGTFDAYPRWVSSVFYPAWIESGDNWEIWQYSNSASLDGYSGGEHRIDLNVLNHQVTLTDLTV